MSSSDLAGRVGQPLRTGLQGHERAQLLLCPAQTNWNFRGWAASATAKIK